MKRITIYHEGEHHLIVEDHDADRFTEQWSRLHGNGSTPPPCTFQTHARYPDTNNPYTALVDLNICGIVKIAPVEQSADPSWVTKKGEQE